MKGIGLFIAIYAVSVLFYMCFKYLYIWFGADISLLIIASVCLIVGVSMIIFSNDD